MKKIILSLMFMMAASMGANAMSLERAQAEALYLTDKMAYELNLNDQQYNDAYEINLDYFLCVDSPSDLYGSYYDYRLSDLRCILHDWQYTLLTAADYFLRPLAWRAGSWFFPIYSYYRPNYFYYGRPSVWVSYRGGHSRYYHHAGFYAHRRPMWNGGLRGRGMHHPAIGHRPGIGGHRPGVSAHRPSGGHSGHSSFGGTRNFNGNSFDRSSSRSHGGSHGSPSMGGGSHNSSRNGGFSGSRRGSSPSFSGGSRGGGHMGGGMSRGSSHGGGSRGGRR